VVLTALDPVVDVALDPRWGRVEEPTAKIPIWFSRIGCWPPCFGFPGDFGFKDKKRVNCYVEVISSGMVSRSNGMRRRRMSHCASCVETFLFAVRAAIKKESIT